MKIFFSLCCPILKSQEGYLVKVTSVVGDKCRTGDQGLRGDEDVIWPRRQTFSCQETRDLTARARLIRSEGQNLHRAQERLDSGLPATLGDTWATNTLQFTR